MKPQHTSTAIDVHAADIEVETHTDEVTGSTAHTETDESSHAEKEHTEAMVPLLDQAQLT